MFILDKEISSIEDTLVTFADGTTEIHSLEELSYIVTPEAIDSYRLSYLTDIAFLKVIHEVYKDADMAKMFSEDEKVRDDHNVNLVAEIIKKSTVYNFPVSKLQSTFGYEKQGIGLIENLTMNNIRTIEDDLLVKALKIGKLGDATFSDYAKFISE